MATKKVTRVKKSVDVLTRNLFPEETKAPAPKQDDAEVGGRIKGLKKPKKVAEHIIEPDDPADKKRHGAPREVRWKMVTNTEFHTHEKMVCIRYCATCQKDVACTNIKAHGSCPKCGIGWGPAWEKKQSVKTAVEKLGERNQKPY